MTSESSAVIADAAPLTAPVMEEIRARVSLVCTEAEGVVSLEFVPEDADTFPDWQAGAHIDVVMGPELVRQYSLCSDPADRHHWRIAVLREPKSRGGSEFIHTQINVGDVLVLRGPRNHFPLLPAQEYVLVAGGIGITPILTMAEELERQGKNWKLLYGGRSENSMAFTELLKRHGERVCIRPEDRFGLLDLKSWVGESRAECLVYCCGPERLLQALEHVCADWPEESVQIERFRAADEAALVQDGSFDVILAKSNMTVHIDEGRAIADVLEEAGVYIPRSCNEGSCGTCITKVLDGEPDHRDSFLRGKMRENNKHIMVCCSRAKTKTITLNV